MDLVLGQPVVGLRRPILLAGFGGWGDAGSAASIALRHILGENPPSACAMVDPSACYDFTVARPQSSRREGTGGWSLEYPKVAFYPLFLPNEERDLLLVIGPEPHFRWPQLAPAMISYAQLMQVESVVTLGGFVGAVSHHSAPVTSRALDPMMEERLATMDLHDSGYEGPTAFVTALLHAAAAASLSAASLWVATPPYLQSGNPVAALALLEALNRVTGLTLPTGALSEVATSFLDDVEAALQEHPELADQLREMLEEAGADDEDAEDAASSGATSHAQDLDRPPPGAPPGLPTGKALVEAVERYLRQARGDDPDTPPA